MGWDQATRAPREDDDIVVVDEEEIAAAVYLLIERQKLVAEGAGAVALAALMADRCKLPSAGVAALVVTGGNIDVNIIGRIIDRGLVKDGRITHLMVKVPDRPGSLAKLTRMVAEAGTAR